LSYTASLCDIIHCYISIITTFLMTCIFLALLEIGGGLNNDPACVGHSRT
jgi:hypothetical protein